MGKMEKTKKEALIQGLKNRLKKQKKNNTAVLNDEDSDKKTFKRSNIDIVQK